MRDVNRIEPFMLEMAKLWKEKFPDWRFGQLMYNFFYQLGDPFYYEEEDLLEAFKAYCDGENPKEAIRRIIDQRLKDKYGDKAAELGLK